MKKLLNYQKVLFSAVIVIVIGLVCEIVSFVYDNMLLNIIFIISDLTFVLLLIVSLFMKKKIVQNNDRNNSSKTILTFIRVLTVLGIIMAIIITIFIFR